MRLFEIFPLISFIVLVLMIAGRIIFLKKKKVPVNTKTKKNAILNFLLYPIFLLLFLLLIFELTKQTVQISLVIMPNLISNNLVDSFFLKIFGTLLIIVSLICMGFTLWNFNKSLRLGTNSNNLGKLITKGIFAITRNPFFVSIALYFVGIALVISNLFFVGIALSTIISIHFFILKEEKFMRKNYGKEYENYVKKVKRYF